MSAGRTCSVATLAIILVSVDCSAGSARYAWPYDQCVASSVELNI